VAQHIAAASPRRRSPRGRATLKRRTATAYAGFPGAQAQRSCAFAPGNPGLDPQLYPHSPFGLVARVAATHKRDKTVAGPPHTDPLFRGFGIPENEQEEEEGGLLVPVQCDTRPSDRVGVWCSLLMARPVSSAAALRAACCTYRPTFSRCFIVNKPYSSNLKLSCNS
jgi:hypothetical protein